MSSSKYCCVPGCIAIGGSQSTLHGFPNPEKDRERFNTWLYVIGGDILSLENHHIFKSRRVCRSHFEDRYLCRNKKISCIAVPTLNVPGRFSKKKVPSESQPLQETVNVAEPTTLSEPELRIQEPLSVTSPPMINEKDISYLEPELRIQEPLSVTSPPMINEKDISYLEPELRIQEPLSVTSPPVIYEKNISYLGSGLWIQEPVPETNPLVVNKPDNEYLEKKTRKKIVYSEREQVLYKKLVAARVKICRLEKKVKRQAIIIKLAKKLANQPDLISGIEKSICNAKLDHHYLVQLTSLANSAMRKAKRQAIKKKASNIPCT